MNANFPEGQPIHSWNICQHLSRLRSENARQKCHACSCGNKIREKQRTQQVRAYWKHCTSGCFIAERKRVTGRNVSLWGEPLHCSSPESNCWLAMKSGSLVDLFGLSGTRMKGWEGWISWTWLWNRIRIKIGNTKKNGVPITRSAQADFGTHSTLIPLRRCDGGTCWTCWYWTLFLDCGVNKN